MGVICFWLLFSHLSAQQVPLVQHQIMRENIANPALFRDGPMHELILGYQQWNVTAPGIKFATEYLRYQSRPLASNPRLGWGIWANHQQIHTESRFELSPTFSAKVVESENLKVSLGITAGIISQNSNFNTVRRHHFIDPFLNQTNSLLEINAGLGGSLQYERSWILFRSDIMATQLPGNILQEEALFPLVPHWMGSAELLVRPVYNFSVGPRIFHRSMFSQENSVPKVEGTDFGVIGAFDRQNLWFSTSYRPGPSAVSAGFGMRIMNPDTVVNPYAFASFVDFQVFFSHPLAPSLKPAAEIGMSINLGRPQKMNPADTLRWARPFWKSESWMTAHKESLLSPNGPMELEAFQEVSGRNVYLRFEFPDASRLYAGDDLYFEDTLVQYLGMEWEGVDGLMQGLVNESIREALTPDTTRIRDMENIEPLQNITWIEFYSFLRVDAQMADFCSDVEYGGEVKGGFTTGDTLWIDVVVDDNDTTLTLIKNQCMTNLELAALKLFMMRSRFHSEFEKRYGQMMRLAYEESFDPFDVDNRPPIRCKKLRIRTNHPHMQVFQTNFINMKFRRYKEFVNNIDPQWTPRIPRHVKEEMIDKEVENR